FFDETALAGVETKLRSLLAEGNVTLDGFYFCPHHPSGTIPGYATACRCRKPLPGMLFQAASDHGIDLGRSWMIGDILHDVEAGSRAGCRTILINNGNETEWISGEHRVPHSMADDLRQAAEFILNSESVPA
ncbi:MAG TPA: HAD-IIIA family hydrolase, partial [Sphingobacteriaceae bacterium]